MVAVCEKVITQVGNVSDYMLHPPGINLLQVFLPVNPIISVGALTPNEEAAHLYSQFSLINWSHTDTSRGPVGVTF